MPPEPSKIKTTEEEIPSEVVLPEAPEKKVIQTVDKTRSSNIEDDLGNQLTKIEKTDLTDNGATTIHKHDHGGQDGLADDDHTIYTKADGTRAFTGDQSMGSKKLTNVADPTADQDAATKKYVDDNASFIKSLGHPFQFIGYKGDGLTETKVAGGIITRGDSDTVFNCDSGHHADLSSGDFNRFVIGTDTLLFAGGFEIIGGTVKDFFMGINVIGSVNPIPANGAYTAIHFGFLLADTTLYVTNADGTTQKKTDIHSQLTLTNPNSIAFVITGTTDIKFYINGILVATHTDNIPTTGTARIFTGLEGLDASQQVAISNSYTLIKKA